MLQRKPTRIELRPEDKEEYEAAKRLASQQLQEQQTPGQQQPQAPAQHGDLSPYLAGPPMEVEVKLRLEGEDAYNRAEALLGSTVRAVHEQENYFFDGPNRELNQRRIVLRMRFYNGDQKAVLTLKGEQILKDGVGRASEVEEALPDAAAARTYLQDPSALLLHRSPLLANLTKQYGLRSLVCLGGFCNLRKELPWEGFLLELDRTSYEWGTLHELECETSHPEQLRDRLEALLREHGIPYRYTTTSKFANFIKRTLE